MKLWLLGSLMPGQDSITGTRIDTIELELAQQFLAVPKEIDQNQDHLIISDDQRLNVACFLFVK